MDPLLNQCYLIHPGKEIRTAGPYNQAHGERLLTVYEQHDRTKGRVMLVDDDLLPYFMDLNSNPTNPDPAIMPSRLLYEHAEFSSGFEPGPLMKKERQFQQLLARNLASRHSLSMATLQNIQRQGCHTTGSVKLCYCQVDVSQDVQDMVKKFGKGYVRCSYSRCKFGNIFHKHCVRRLGFEKVSRWYCTACEKQMKIEAHKALGLPYDAENMA